MKRRAAAASKVLSVTVVIPIAVLCLAAGCGSGKKEPDAASATSPRSGGATPALTATVSGEKQPTPTTEDVKSTATLPAVPALTVEALRNAAYRSEWVSGGLAQLIDGEYTQTYDEEPASQLIITLTDFVAFGDLDGNGIDDAAVILVTTGGGSGAFYDLAAVLNEQGQPRHVDTASLGDRVVIQALSVESGEIMVPMVAHGEDDPLCCPTMQVTRRYELDERRLVELP